MVTWGHGDKGRGKERERAHIKLKGHGTRALHARGHVGKVTWGQGEMHYLCMSILITILEIFAGTGCGGKKS